MDNLIHHLKKTQSCPLCKNQEFSIIHQINSYQIIQCNHCRLIFAELNLPEKQQNQFLKQIYSEQYFSTDSSDSDAKKLGYERDYFQYKGEEKIVNAHRRLFVIEKRVPEKGRILDIGCAGGFFLKVARERGWQPYGLELAVAAAEFARTQFRLDVKTGDFETVDLPKNFYNVITAWDVIEHILNPVRFIEKVKKLLVPGGLLVLGTPNVGSLAYLIRRQHWPILKPPEHLFYFSPITLEKLLKTQFEDVKIVVSFPPFFKVQPSLKAFLKRVLYQGFNYVAHIIRRGEYLIAYAKKQRER